MSETAQELGRRWFEEVWNQGRREAIAQMLSPDCIIHDGEIHSTGPEGFYPFFDRMSASFSELNVTVEDIVAQDNLACVRWTCTARHTGPGLGMVPSGRTVHMSGITIVRASAGKIVEAWQNWDMLGMLEQIQSAVRPAATYIGAS
jgi:steroid delta-isomerase-like uncharacterized protein